MKSRRVKEKREESTPYRGGKQRENGEKKADNLFPLLCFLSFRFLFRDYILEVLVSCEDNTNYHGHCEDQVCWCGWPVCAEVKKGRERQTREGEKREKRGMGITSLLDEGDRVLSPVF